MKLKTSQEGSQQLGGRQVAERVPFGRGRRTARKRLVARKSPNSEECAEYSEKCQKVGEIPQKVIAPIISAEESIDLTMGETLQEKLSAIFEYR